MSKTTLDSIILQYRAELNQGLNELAGRGTPEEQMKQAITSLIKELVAEAKPNKKPQFFCQGCDESEGRGHNQAINEFEQNLLKKLEEK